MSQSRWSLLGKEKAYSVWSSHRRHACPPFDPLASANDRNRLQHCSLEQDTIIVNNTEATAERKSKSSPFKEPKGAETFVQVRFQETKILDSKRTSTRPNMVRVSETKSDIGPVYHVNAKHVIT